MNDLVKFKNILSPESLIERFSGIKEIKPTSDATMLRVRIIFLNGHTLSVIAGKYAHSDKNNPFEVALITANNRGFISELLEPDNDDDVIGYVSQEKLLEYLGKINEFVLQLEEK